MGACAVESLEHRVLSTIYPSWYAPAPAAAPAHVVATRALSVREGEPPTSSPLVGCFCVWPRRCCARVKCLRSKVAQGFALLPCPSTTHLCAAVARARQAGCAGDAGSCEGGARWFWAPGVAVLAWVRCGDNDTEALGASLRLPSLVCCRPLTIHLPRVVVCWRARRVQFQGKIIQDAKR